MTNVMGHIFYVSVQAQWCCMHACVYVGWLVSVCGLHVI